MNKQLTITIPLLALFLLIFSACGKESEQQRKVALVNGAPIFLKNYKEEIALISRSNPAFKVTRESLEEQLNTVIDKKLMIQEAVRLGLSDDDQFLKTIKRFWEQTLIRELIGVKSAEWSDHLFATDSEVRSHYERMRYALTLTLATAENSEKAEALREAMKSGRPVDGEETMGPLLLEDIQMSHPLYDAFVLSPGDTKIFQEDSRYSVIRIVKKETIPLTPLPEMYGRLRGDIIAQKQQKALETWLEELRTSSDITVNYSILQEVARDH